MYAKGTVCPHLIDLGVWFCPRCREGGDPLRGMVTFRTLDWYDILPEPMLYPESDDLGRDTGYQGA